MPDVVYLFNAHQPRDKGGKWTTLPGFSGNAGDDALLKKKLASLASQKSNAKKAGDAEKLAKVEQTMKLVKEAHAAAKAKKPAQLEELTPGAASYGDKIVSADGKTFTIYDINGDNELVLDVEGQHLIQSVTQLQNAGYKLQKQKAEEAPGTQPSSTSLQVGDEFVATNGGHVMTYVGVKDGFHTLQSQDGGFEWTYNSAEDIATSKGLVKSSTLKMAGDPKVGDSFVSKAGTITTIGGDEGDGFFKVTQKFSDGTEMAGVEHKDKIKENLKNGSWDKHDPSASQHVGGMVKGDQYKVIDTDGAEYGYEITGFKPNGDVLLKTTTGGQAGKEYAIPKSTIESDMANPTFTKVSQAATQAAPHGMGLQYNPGDIYQSKTGTTYEVVGTGSAPGYYKVKAKTAGGKELTTDMPASALDSATVVKIAAPEPFVSKASSQAAPVATKPSPYEGVDVGHKVVFQGAVHTVKDFTSNGEFVLDDPNGTYFGDFNASPGGVFVPHLPKGKQPLDQIDNPSGQTVPAAASTKSAGLPVMPPPSSSLDMAKKSQHLSKTTTELTNELKAAGVPYAGSMPKDMKAEVLAWGIGHPKAEELIAQNKSEYLAKYSGGTKPTSSVPGPKAPSPSPGLAQNTQPTKEAQAQAVGAKNHQIPAGALAPKYPPTHGQAKSFTYDKEFHGTHERYLFKDEKGETWMIKPQTSKALADTEVAAHKLGWLAGHDLSDIRTMEVNLPGGQKKIGAMQKFHDADGTFQDKGITAAKLTPQHRAQVMQAQVLDWFLSNHDTHSENLLVGKDGNIKQIDKGQAWRYFGKDKLSESYNPNPVTPFYNSMWKDYIGGKVNMSFDDALPAIKSIKAIPDAVVVKEVMHTFQARDKIAYNGKGGWGETGFKNSQEAMQALLHRKNNIDKEFEAFFKSMSTKRALNTGSASVWTGWGDNNEPPF